MKRSIRALVVAVAVMVAASVFGFLLFATMVTREVADDSSRADGIVVLTGGELRIAQAARLLDAGRGRRLLISGVNPRTTRQDLLRITGLAPERFDCCVDLGYWAQDTHGNASETRMWAERNRFQSLIVVTSSYHMPRGMAELKLEMPRARLHSHTVMPPSLNHTTWWLHPMTTRVLLAEYVKYVPAMARLTANRILGSFDESSLAAAPRDASGKI